MNNGQFEWDDAKAAANHAAHGVTFEAACGVFKDPFALDWRDDRQAYGETRYVTIGMAEGRLIYVAYAMRGGTVRIISARGAEPFERRRYHEDDE